MTDVDVGEVLRSAAQALSAYATKPPPWTPLPHQVPPPGDWYGWLLNAGRGSGKTDAVAHYVTEHVKGPACLHGPTPHWIGIIAPTLGDAVTACYAGPSGLRAHDPTAKLVMGAGGTLVRWPNGSEAKLFGAHEPEDVERLRAGGNRCVISGTLVHTERGEVPIEQIRVGERVWTRRGLRRVLHTWDNGTRPTWRLETVAGNVVEGTADHPVETQRGVVELQFLRPGDKLVAWKNLTSSSGTAFVGDVDATATTGLSTDYFTALCGLTPTDRYPRGSGYTTAITTSGTTHSKIYKHSYRVNTSDTTWKVERGRGTHVLAQLRGRTETRSTFSVRSAEWRSAVEVHASLASAEPYVVLTRWLIARLGPHEHSTNGCARCAAESFERQHVSAFRRARDRARQHTQDAHESRVTVDASLMNSALASTAEQSFTSRVIDPPSLAQDRVLRTYATNDVKAVYDLTVEHDHEFFAGDVLVLNCLIWAEELAAWRYLQACWEQMRFGLRVGPRPRWCASTTPKPRPLIKKLVKETPHNVVVTRASTRDNPHLQDEVREALHEEYGGTQLGRQELDADLLEEDRDALWTRATLDRYRLIAPPDAAYRARTVVGVDPSGGAGEQGIVVVTKSLPEALAGLISDPHAYAGGANPPVPRPGARSIHHGVVLDDRTCCLPPAGWGRRAVRAAIDWDADELVVERNFGGAMATATLLDACEAEGVDVPVREVVASRGKRVRAEPVSALSERGRWHMAGNFPELEDQCCTWTEESNYSPDRLDAMVWPAWRLKLVSVRTRGVGRLPLREMSETPISNGTA